MAVLAQKFLTLADLAKRGGGKGAEMAQVIELLAQENPILEDAVAMECNQGKSHLHNIRTRLPQVAWGKLYKGIPQSKSDIQQVEDTTGFVEALATIDSRLLKLSKNPAQVRLTDSSAFIEALNQEVATGIFYHDTKTGPEKFMGLSVRYSEYANGDKGKGAANQVIDGGGRGSDNTSIWFVTWGDRFTHLLYPQGSTAGVQREDKGEQRIHDDQGNPFYVKEELFSWHVGMAVNDWRYNARIANIDASEVAAGNVDVYALMRQAYYRLKSRRVPGGKTCIYMNSDMMEALDKLATNAGSSDNFVRLTRQDVAGEEVLTYRGIPIRETDALLNSEEMVPAAQ
jgi:hypothetical protein